VTIRGLRIVVGPGSEDGIDVYGEDVRIDRVRVEGFPFDGIYIGGRTSPAGRAQDVIITHSVVQRAARNAVSVTSAARVRIAGNVLAGAGDGSIAGPGAGVDIEPNAPSNPISDISIADNLIVGNAGTGVELALDPSAGLPTRASGITIVGNLFVGNSLLRSRGGMTIAGGQRDGRGRVRILDNRFESNGGVPILRGRHLHVWLLLQHNVGAS
jgi:hypothetical protein